MRHALLIAACLAVGPCVASASCFSVYSPKNQLVMQSTVPPIDLSVTITEAMRRRFPGHHLVWSADDDTCREIGGSVYTSNRSEVAGNVGFTDSANRSPIEASPIFREITPGLSSIDVPNARTAPRREQSVPVGATPVPDARR